MGAWPDAQQHEHSSLVIARRKQRGERLTMMDAESQPHDLTKNNSYGVLGNQVSDVVVKDHARFKDADTMDRDVLSTQPDAPWTKKEPEEAERITPRKEPSIPGRQIF